jgi:hypothetical protein
MSLVLDPQPCRAFFRQRSRSRAAEKSRVVSLQRLGLEHVPTFRGLRRRRIQFWRAKVSKLLIVLVSICSYLVPQSAIQLANVFDTRHARRRDCRHVDHQNRIG